MRNGMMCFSCFFDIGFIKGRSRNKDTFGSIATHCADEISNLAFL